MHRNTLMSKLSTSPITDVAPMQSDVSDEYSSAFEWGNEARYLRVCDYMSVVTLFIIPTPTGEGKC